MKTFTHKRTVLALALVGTFAAQSAWACKAPAAPKSLPDGRSADMQVMLDARQQVEQYLDHVSDYFSCENDAQKLQEVSERQKSVMNRFNAEVRAFKAVNRDGSARSAHLIQD